MKIFTLRPIRFALATACLLPLNGLLAGDLVVTEPVPALATSIELNGYAPPMYEVTDPTETVVFGVQPVFSMAGRFCGVSCANGVARLTLTQNPGTNTLSLAASAGQAQMNFGMTNGLNIKFQWLQFLLTGALKPSFMPNCSFVDSKPISSYLLDSPVKLSATAKQTVLEVDLVEELAEACEWESVFLDIYSIIEQINLQIYTFMEVDQSIQGEQITSSAGIQSSEGQALGTEVSGLTYQLGNIQETWQDKVTTTAGLGADVNVTLLWVIDVVTFDFGEIPLVQVNDTYQLTSDPIPDVRFDFSSLTNQPGVLPTITGQPGPQTDQKLGSSASFTVTATGLPPLSYQWRKNGTPLSDGGDIAGSTTAALTVNPIAAADLGAFDVVVSNGFGAVASQAAPLTRFHSSQIAVLKTGNGTISPNYNGQALTMGNSYTMTATPAAGYLFQSWAGGINSTNTTVSFVMCPDLVLVANFVPNSYLAGKGTFNGLFFVTNSVLEVVSNSFLPPTAVFQTSVDTCGTLANLVVSSKGAYSGKLWLKGKSYPITGKFDAFWNANNVISRPPEKGGPIFLTMTWCTSNPPVVYGTVSGSNGTAWAATLVADRAAKSSPAAQYTLFIPPDPDSEPPESSPGGAGYAAINYQRGTAKIAGSLADGTAFSQSAPASEDGYVPIYTPLYSGKGLLVGWINLNVHNASRTSLIWVHPPCGTGCYTNGFTNAPPQERILVCKWTKSPATILAATNLCLLGTIDGTDPSFRCPLVFGKKFSFSGTYTESSGAVTVTGSINPNNGLWKATLTGGTNIITGYGAFDLDCTNGLGYFLLPPDLDGALRLEP